MTTSGLRTRGRGVGGEATQVVVARGADVAFVGKVMRVRRSSAKARLMAAAKRKASGQKEEVITR